MSQGLHTAAGRQCVAVSSSMLNLAISRSGTEYCNDLMAYDTCTKRASRAITGPPTPICSPAPDLSETTCPQRRPILAAEKYGQVIKTYLPPCTSSLSCLEFSHPLKGVRWGSTRVSVDQLQRSSLVRCSLIKLSTGYG